MYRGMCYGTYATSLVLLAGMCGQQNLALQYQATLSSYISTAKNVLANEFLKSEHDYLLYLDTDIGFDPRDVFIMMEMMEKSEIEIMGGTYVTKAIQWEKVREAAKKDKKDLSKFTSEFAVRFKPGMKEFKINEPVEVEAIPGGFLVIKRSALLKFRDKFPERKFRERLNQDPITQFFHSETYPDSAYISEDFWFCDRMRECGVKIYLAPWVKLTHYGEHIFTGNMMDTFVDEGV